MILVMPFPQSTHWLRVIVLWLCGVLAALALFGIMGLTLVDVSGRKLLSASVTGSLEVTELLLVVVGGLFVLEALSVLIQVASFKLRGKRVFKMAPIHHHFELAGWSETKVTIRFWIISLIFALMSLGALKLR